MIREQHGGLLSTRRDHGAATAILPQAGQPAAAAQAGDRVNPRASQAGAAAGPEAIIAGPPLTPSEPCGSAAGLRALSVAIARSIDQLTTIAKSIAPSPRPGASPLGLAPEFADEQDRRLECNRIVTRSAAHFACGETDAAMQLLGKLEALPIDDQMIRQTDPFLRPWIAGGRRVVASFDPRRVPGPDEVVVIYGNYPHIFENLVINNPVKRHVGSFWDLVHDRVEYHPAWHAVDQIYIINMEKRVDRYDAVLRELSAARAPLDRVTRVEAIVPTDSFRDPQLTATVGCLESHLAVLRRARDNGFANVLVLEDDFCFTSDLDRHLQDLASFFARQYQYWLCLLGTSKYGEIVVKDDLVCLSFQPCTTTVGYLISQEGIGHVLAVQEYALQKLKETGDTKRYAADRYWTTLQPFEKFMVFRRKFGFQATSFSDIEGSVNRCFD